MTDTRGEGCGIWPVVFGYWTAIREADDKRWFCKCTCGLERAVLISSLKRGLSRSCGCQGRRYCRQFKSEKRAWTLMRYRCSAPGSADFENYGGRGIAVCSRWESFENFLTDMGPKPFKGATIDRMNVEKGYEPGNCRWVSLEEQARNKRTTRWVAFRGRRMCLREAAREYGIGYTTLRARLGGGWGIERALTTPTDERFSHRRGH